MSINVPADSELERWSAEKVMGWTQVAGDKIGKWFRIEHIEIPVYIMECKDWHPLTDLNQTFMCVEKMREKGWPEFRLEYGNPETELGLWYCDFVKPDVYIQNNWAEDSNPARAILLAMWRAENAE